jgi:glycosyltransferase involved in cell wall biosynthesis
MTRVAILTPGISSGDAVSNDVAGMYEALAQGVHDVRIYAEVSSFTRHKIWPAAEIGLFLRESKDLLIYHYSTGWDAGLRLLLELPSRRVVRYHNVTPPEFFIGLGGEHVHYCWAGRDQLRDIARAGCELYLSDSTYNMREMVRGGAPEPRNRVVPPFHHIEQLRATEPDARVLERYRDGKTNLLMVGRVAPHKGHPALIKAFSIYHQHYNRASRLLIVGKEEAALSRYSRLLRKIVADFNLQDAVEIVGEVTESELKAYYMIAGAFVMASEHEGFCVPVVEAMAMKVPVVGYTAGAVGETVGGAGVIWEERDAALLARSVDHITRDGSAGFAFGMSGWRRYEEFFTNEVIGATFLRAVGEIL